MRSNAGQPTLGRLQRAPSRLEAPPMTFATATIITRKPTCTSGAMAGVRAV